MHNTPGNFTVAIDDHRGCKCSVPWRSPPKAWERPVSSSHLCSAAHTRSLVHGESVPEALPKPVPAEGRPRFRARRDYLGPGHDAEGRLTTRSLPPLRLLVVASPGRGAVKRGVDLGCDLPHAPGHGRRPERPAQAVHLGQHHHVPEVARSKRPGPAPRASRSFSPRTDNRSARFCPLPRALLRPRRIARDGGGGLNPVGGSSGGARAAGPGLGDEA